MTNDTARENLARDTRTIVSDLQSARDRLMPVLAEQYGDAFDGDFDSMLEAINALKRFATAALTPQQGGEQEAVATVCLRGDTYGNGLFTELQVQHKEGVTFPIGTKFYLEPRHPADEQEARECDDCFGHGILLDADIPCPKCSGTGVEERAWQSIETAEVEFLNNLAEKGGLADPVPGMLRHCARLIAGKRPAVVAPDRYETEEEGDAYAHGYVDGKDAATAIRSEQEARDVFVVTDSVVNRLCDTLWPNNGNWRKPLCDTTKPYKEQLRSIVRDALTTAIRSKQEALVPFARDEINLAFSALNVYGVYRADPDVRSACDALAAKLVAASQSVTNSKDMQ